MKVVILAGGAGSRIQPVSADLPKPLVKIGEWPILFHVMDIYASQGFHDFTLLLGHHSEKIRLAINETRHRYPKAMSWKINMLDTGLDTMTGGRLLRARSILDQTFFLTYADGLADIRLSELLKCHREKNKAVTLTAVHPYSRFGELTFNENGEIQKFMEKPEKKDDWVSGGFFVCEPTVFDYLDLGDSTIFEKKLETLLQHHQLNAYKHGGRWRCMDNKADSEILNELWKTKNAFWNTSL